MSVVTLPHRHGVAVILDTTTGIRPEINTRLLSNIFYLNKANTFILANRSEIAHEVSNPGYLSVHIAKIAVFNQAWVLKKVL